jgi:hypothetical protein
MKNTKKMRSPIYLFAIVLISIAWVTVAAADPAELAEASIQAYLEKKAVADPGSCLVENQKVEIVGIADLVPEHQTEVFYKYEYMLRCNRSKDAKSGQGVLKPFACATAIGSIGKRWPKFQNEALADSSTLSLS